MLGLVEPSPRRQPGPPSCRGRRATLQVVGVPQSQRRLPVWLLGWFRVHERGHIASPWMSLGAWRTLVLDKSDRLSHISSRQPWAWQFVMSTRVAGKSETEMPPNKKQRFERLDELFGLFVPRSVRRVLGRLHRPAGPERPRVSRTGHDCSKSSDSGVVRSDAGTRGGAFRSSVCFILATEHEAVVVLTHLIDRNGCTHRYQTVNHCTLRQDLLAAWFNLPMNATEYPRAWDLQRVDDARLASGVS